MKNKMFHWCLMLGWMLVVCSIGRAEWRERNKIVNGDFSQFPTTGWNISGTFVHLVSSDPKYSPNYLALAPAIGETVVASQDVSGLSANTDYKVTVDHAFWNNADPYWPEKRGAHSKLRVTDLAGNQLGVYEQGYSGAWTTYEVTFNTGNNTAIRINLVGYGDEEPGWNNNYSTWFDNVKLYEWGEWLTSNKVVNGNFTDFPTTGWTISGTFVHLTSSDALYAPNFLGLAPGVGETAVASQEINGLHMNTDCRVTVDHAFWNNNDPYWPEKQGAHSKLQVTDLAGNELASYEQGYSGAWVTYDVAFNTGPNTSIRINLIAYGDEEPGWNNNYCTWFDNVKLYIWSHWYDTKRVLNGSFNMHPVDGWNVSGTIAHVSAADSKYAPYLLGLAPEIGETSAVSQDIAGLLPNADYKVTADHAFWNNADPFWPVVKGAHSKLQVTDLAGNELASYEYGYSGAWQNWELVFNTGANTAIRINLIGYGDAQINDDGYNWNNNYTTWFDNVTLWSQISTPMPQNLAFNVPSNGTIVPDGSLSDWLNSTDWSAAYILWNVPGGQVPLTSTTKAKFAWNDENDLLYVAIQTDEHSLRNGGHVVVGISNSSDGVAYSGLGATQLCFDLNLDGSVQIRNEIAAYGGVGGVYGISAGCKASGGVWTYEIAIPFWNNWADVAQGRTTMKSGDKVYVYSCVESDFKSGNGTDMTFYGNPGFANPGGFQKAATLTLVPGTVVRMPGDANGDRMVDVGDLGILAANYGGSGKTWAQGDFNGDTLVDVGDLGILAAHYGEGSTQVSSFSEDYAKAFGTAVSDDNESNSILNSSVCSGLGLPLIAGLALMGLMLVKMEE